MFIDFGEKSLDFQPSQPLFYSLLLMLEGLFGPAFPFGTLPQAQADLVVA
jgi:hypothetical protein